MKERLDKEKRGFLLVLLLGFAFYLWYACQLPYTHDDWDWGLSSGMRHLLTADVNSRYAGNLVEVLLTRSLLAKDLVVALVMTGIPLCGTLFTLRFSGTRRFGALLLLAANFLQLVTIPEIWKQTYGWIAGFSNFTVSALFLGVFHYLLADGLTRTEKRPLWALPLLFVFGLAHQLFLENIAVYALLLLLAALVLKALRRKRLDGGDAALLLGLLLGTALMFSSGIYATLLDTGSAVGGYRQLTFDKDAGFFAIAFSLAKRFLILFPPSLWAASPVPVAAVLLLTAALLLKKKLRGAPVLAALNAAFALYVGYVYFFGDFGRLILASSWWSNAISALIGLAIGALVLLELILLWRKEPQPLCFSLFCWLSRPAVMLPMVVISNSDPRCFLTTDVLLAPLVLQQLAQLWPAENGKKRLACRVCAIALLCAALLQVAVPFAAIGRVSRERSALIRAAQQEPGGTLVLPAYPERLRELLWDPDPVSPTSEYVGYFREFYGVPEETQLWFESWDEKSESP